MWTEESVHREGVTELSLLLQVLSILTVLRSSLHTASVSGYWTVWTQIQLFSHWGSRHIFTMKQSPKLPALWTADQQRGRENAFSDQTAVETTAGSTPPPTATTTTEGETIPSHGRHRGGARSSGSTWSTSTWVNSFLFMPRLRRELCCCFLRFISK